MHPPYNPALQPRYLPTMHPPLRLSGGQGVSPSPILIQHRCRYQRITQAFQFLIAFIDRHFTDFTDGIHIAFTDIQLTLVCHEEDNPRSNRVWCVFRNKITGLDPRCNKFTKFR